MSYATQSVSTVCDGYGRRGDNVGATLFSYDQCSFLFGYNLGDSVVYV